MSSGPGNPVPPSGGGGGPRGKPSSGGGGGSNYQYAKPFTPSATNRVDEGVDYTVNGKMVAVGDCVIVTSHGGFGGGAYIGYKLLAGPLAGAEIYYSEGISPAARVGQHVARGGLIANASGGVECGWSSGDWPLAYSCYNEADCTASGRDFDAFMQKLGVPASTGCDPSGSKTNCGGTPFADGGSVASGGGSGSGAGGGGTDPEAIAKAAAFATFIDLPGLLDQAESLALQGERSLMNDQPLLPAVEQICQASLRNFQSMPNGNFFAFYPDYFGGLNHRTPYWEIHDIEIIDGQIQLSDDALATHVYVVGDTMNFDGQVEIFEKMASAGVVTVFNAFMADFVNGVNSPALEQRLKNKKKQKKAKKQYEKEIQRFPTLANKDAAISFLRKYGARPLYQEMPMIRSHYYELFYAYQTFCLFWSKQFLSRFEFTFMPELFPGGIISFPDHGIQCYVDEVTHNCDYESGFTTEANLIAPAALKGKDGKAMDERRHWVNQGMVRAGAISVNHQGKNS